MTMTLQGPDSTVRIEVLGEELRRLREAAGLTLTQVVEQIGIHYSHLSRLETGKRPPNVADVAALLVVYGVTGQDRRDLLELTKPMDQPGWLQNHTRSFAARVSALRILESRATALFSFETSLVPGLLQTVPYAQAVFREVAMITDLEEVDRRMVTRIQRQAVLRARATTLLAMVCQPALETPVGGVDVLRDQLHHLVEAAARPNISLRVLPTSVGAHPGLSGAFLRMRFADRPNVVFLGGGTASLFLEEADDIEVYKTISVELLGLALNEEESVAFVASIAANLE
jgi:transcriptional regulator with XRE-family HTH domain